MGWEFAAFLVGALVLSMLLGMWQQNRYAKSVNAFAAQHRGDGRLLITGRGLGKLKGTIVILVIDDARDEVVAAQALRGSTIFATAKPAPELIGPLATLAERAPDKPTSKAIDMALTQLKATRARLQETPVVRSRTRVPSATPKRKVSR